MLGFRTFEVVGGCLLFLASVAVPFVVCFSYRAFQEHRWLKRWAAEDARWFAELAEARAARAAFLREQSSRLRVQAAARSRLKLWQRRWQRRRVARAGLRRQDDPPPPKPRKLDFPGIAIEGLSEAGFWSFQGVLLATVFLPWDYMGAVVFAFCIWLVIGLTAAAAMACVWWLNSEKPAGGKLATAAGCILAFVGFCAATGWLDKHAPGWWPLVLMGATLCFVGVRVWRGARQRRRQRGSNEEGPPAPPDAGMATSGRI